MKSNECLIIIFKDISSEIVLYVHKVHLAVTLFKIRIFKKFHVIFLQRVRQY